jgi:hypothetical protein
MKRDDANPAYRKKPPNRKEGEQTLCPAAWGQTNDLTESILSTNRFEYRKESLKKP